MPAHTHSLSPARAYALFRIRETTTKLQIESISFPPPPPHRRSLCLSSHLMPG